MTAAEWNARVNQGFAALVSKHSPAQETAPMHAQTPDADQAIVTSVDNLNRLSKELTTTRAGLAAVRLPNAIANDRLDHADNLLAIVTRLLATASTLMASDFERILRDDSARYDNAANDDIEAPNDDIEPANDDIAALMPALRGGVL